MARIPTATYRLQLHSEFGFEAAAAIADYLQQLGISHVYSSPYLQAAPGSKHGYDVVDPHRVNEELGGAAAHDQFCKELGRNHLGQVLDIVPNHMAISGRRNRYWWDVLENGPASRYASFFDIDWQSPQEKLRNKLLVPILGDHYGRVLTRGELQLKRSGGEFFVQYFDHQLPAAPKSLARPLARAAQMSGSDFLGFLADCLNQLPSAATTEQEELIQRDRDKTVIRAQLERLFSETPFIAEQVDHVLAEVNKNPNRLDDVLEQQNYRLAFWRTAEQDLGYRRFFDVNTLVGLRQETRKVFADTHALVIRWLNEGVLDGVRVDHPDGLRDPKLYFTWLRENAEGVWILGEKILEPGEKLRADWPIDGTTGYDYLNEVGGLFVDTENEQVLSNIYSEFTGESTDYDAVSRDKKHRVLRDLLGSDVNRLTTLFTEICECHRDRRDFTQHDVIRAIRELVACFTVYRTYVVPERDEITDDDVRYVNEATALAKAHRPELDPDLFDFLADVLLLRVRGALESDFVMQFQQFTGPAMAKGVEDTVFYNYNRLISLNEVGGDPGRFGICPDQFHACCCERQQSHPRAMLASSTHDTKRSEDVRARISLLSEIPERWKEAVNRWSKTNEKYKKNNLPGGNTEWFLYQTMLGAWPIDTDRLLPYMQKATREAKADTNWLTPNTDFEDATRFFIEGIYKDVEFRQDFEAFVSGLIEPGRVNSLAQLLFKLTSPGVPDLYQGTELWDLSLVDPDNRRPVDYNLRRKLLSELPRLSVSEVLRRSDEGLPKLWTIRHVLELRREKPDTFGEKGGYTPLRAIGKCAEHLVGYLRSDSVAVLAPRLLLKMNGDWSDTTIILPAKRWYNRFTGQTVDGGNIGAKELFSQFPVALLVEL
jgi:(1->4)-alpha-D-glucan 1-alpha-D-glucosylmutase